MPRPSLSLYSALRPAFTSQETLSEMSDAALTSGPPRFVCVVTSLSPAVKIRLASAAGLRLQSPALKSLLTFTPTGKVSCSTVTFSDLMAAPFSVLTSDALVLTFVQRTPA